VLIAAVLGAVAHVVAFLAFELGPLSVLAVGGIVGGLGTWLLLTAGRIDPDARTLSVRWNHWDDEADLRTVDLDGWTGCDSTASARSSSCGRPTPGEVAGHDRDC